MVLFYAWILLNKSNVLRYVVVSGKLIHFQNFIMLPMNNENTITSSKICPKGSSKSNIWFLGNK